MSYTCAISGEVAQEAIATRTGFVFERRLLEKTLKSNGGKCPVTGEPLTIDEAIPLKSESGGVRPRTIGSSSIPNLLLSFQNEWDALVSESFQLKEQLDGLRQQLSLALYQHDAACRVIARVLKEKEESIQEVEKLRRQVVELSASPSSATKASRDSEKTADDGGKSRTSESAAASSSSSPNSRKKNDADGSMMTDATSPPPPSSALPSSVIDECEQIMTTLKSGRRKRKHPALRSSDTFNDMQVKFTYVPGEHNIPEMTCCRLLGGNGLEETLNDAKGGGGRCLVLGGKDGSIVLIDPTVPVGKKGFMKKASDRHEKAVTAIATHFAHNDLFLSAAEDSCIKVWRDKGKGQYQDNSTFSFPSETAACDVALHPSGKIGVSCDVKGLWRILEFSSTKILHEISDNPQTRLTQFHPDGMLIGTGGDDGDVRIWDIRTMASAATLEGGRGVSTSGMSFSENGYYFASSYSNGEVRLWDLRKAEVLQSIPPPSSSSTSSSSSAVLSSRRSQTVPISFDFSGQVLGIGHETELSLFGWMSKTALQDIAALPLSDDDDDRAGAAAEGGGKEKDTILDFTFGPDNEWLSTLNSKGVLQLWQ